MELNYKPPYDFIQGATLLVDKPKHWTSFDVVKKIRFALKKKLNIRKIKVGHSGTLDPMASGLLIICSGGSTKKLNELQGLDKTYVGEMTLGAVTDSYDAETPVRDPKPIGHLTEEMLEQARKLFLGPIQQVPPIYSAIKIDGQPLYKLARKGKKPKVEPREVTIDAFDLIARSGPKLTFEVQCSKGTYIRSLVHDYGQELGCGAYLSGLNRTRIGNYDLKDAWKLEDLITYIEES